MNRSMVFAAALGLSVAAVPQQALAGSGSRALIGGLVGAAIGTAIINSQNKKKRSSSRRSSSRAAAPRVDQEAVKVQKALASAGYYSGPMDGKLDSYATKSGIMQFQQRYNMVPTGILTPDVVGILTYQAELADLGGYLAYAGYEQRGTKKRLQAALKVEGFYTGRIDGAIGPGSRRAISSYQQARGMIATGAFSPDQENALIAEAAQKLAQQKAQTDQQLLQIAQRSAPPQYQAQQQPVYPVQPGQQPQYQPQYQPQPQQQPYPQAQYPTQPAYQPQPPQPQVQPVTPIYQAAAPGPQPQIAAANGLRAAGTVPVALTEPVEGAERPNLYILSIGVSKYSDKGYNLNFADEDAEAVARAFKSQQGKLYERVETRLLTNSLADRDNILDGLEWLIRETTQRDLAVIFVAGHGTKDGGGQYYFMPHDTDMDSLRRTGVKWYEFQDTLDRLPGTRWLLADTCHAGSITGKRGLTRDASDITDALRDLRKVEGGVVVMSAATGRESSVENPEWGHGAFTKALIEGMEEMKANYNGDHRIDLKELDLYVTSRVKELTGGRQHPMTEIPQVVPDFPIAITR
ncbi:MAG: caspase family protein [Gammaproteobacteria bacterium SHHR-1]|uniref:peptidoglycan-binding protein n=1 Tax=Magnetovirga frankeli TaxID=947516 RepID=UPI001AF37978|nr:caspase family protein [gamma proteobacterium SS-5]